MANFKIWANGYPTKPLTPEIFYHISEREFLATDSKWRAYKRLRCPPVPPPNHTWRWFDKVSDAKNDAFVALKFRGEIEGMMMISLEPRPCRIPGSAHKTLLYIEYLENAPWNYATYAGPDAKFTAVGSCLVAVAVELSIQQGCGGRLGLVSLENVKGFYKNRGFENLGKDPTEGLDYFEFNGY